MYLVYIIVRIISKKIINTKVKKEVLYKAN